MKIVYFGGGQFGIDCLNAIAGSGNQLVFIVTSIPAPAGRGQKPRSTAVAQWAKEHRIEFLETENVNNPDVVGRIASFKPDLIVVIAFGHKIGSELIALPPKGMINVHASLLPKYRGAAPINWAIIQGEKQTGISIITVVAKMDAGDVLAQAKTDIAPDETAGRLHDRLAKLSAPLLLETIEKIAKGTAVYTEQCHTEATLAPKLKKCDGFLDFSLPAEVLERRIRGLWPWPGACAVYHCNRTGKEKIVTIAQAKIVEKKMFPTPSNADELAGTLDENLNVICGQDVLEIVKIQPAGGKLLDFKDFVNGQRCGTGDRFIKLKT
jgi:methionyl-tRNA formyltransferase